MSGYESGASLPSRAVPDFGNYSQLETPRNSSRLFALSPHHVVDVPNRTQSFSAADIYKANAQKERNTDLQRGSNTPLPDHRSRFLSDSELLLAADPMHTRESFATLNEKDAKTWHQRSTEIILKMLNTNLDRGLNGMDVERRILRYGLNALEEEAKTPVSVIFLLQFYNLIIAMLLFAALASLALQEWVEGIAILVIITLNAAVATYQEYSASNALAALASLSSPQSLIIRDGMQQVVDSKFLVPGDIVILVTGDVVPADIRLFTSVDLKCNEMLLTGESEDVAKRFNAQICSSKGGKSAKLTANNMVFSSTTITTGNARGIVVETGMNTRVGSIAALLQAKSGKGAKAERKWIRNPLEDCIAKHQPRLTPLQHALHHMGYVMGLIAVAVSLLVFLVGMIRGTKDPRHPNQPTFLTMIMTAVSVAVSAVPEGLPMVVTICLSSGTADMVKKNVLVRKLASVETLGAASVICTDKTGTLTEGKMTAVKLWGDFCEYTITGKGFAPNGVIISPDGTNQADSTAGNVQVRATLMASVLCSNTQLKQVEGEDGEARWIPFGNSSEAPLVVAAAKAGIWEDNLMRDYPRIVEVPFSSSRKMMITVNAMPVVNGAAMFDTLTFSGDRPPSLVASVKGAPNYILRNCTTYCQKDGTLTSLTSVQRDEMLKAVDALSSQALRVLAVAIQPLNQLPFSKDCDDVDEKFKALSTPLIFLGLVASIDPERDGVREAIATARAASIRTVMITGDYLATAVAIAKNIDLLQLGADFDAQATDCTQLRPHGDVYLPPAEIDEITSRTLVFARAKPEDKIEIVKSLQRQGLIAAMTGDGVNDAPALKEADIGVAMGISGTEVAKGASDMILTDDNFCSIVSAVEKGRVIYANIQKFVMFLLSTNIGEILLIFISVAGGFPLPLEALHILLLNLFTDGMPAVALSLEKGDPNIMAEKPRNKKSSLIQGRLWLLVLFNAILLLVGAMITFLLGLYWNFGEVLTKDIYNAGGGSTGTDYTDVTCQRWEGISDGWRVYGNCAAQNKDDSFIFGEEVAGMNLFENSTVHCEGGDFVCVPTGLGRAQTMVFLGLAFTEVLRAYTVRHFTEPVYVRMLSNGYMQLAACMSVLLTVLVSTVPVIMDDIFGFEYIPWFQWLVIGAVAVSNAFWGEVLKAILRRNDRIQARWDHLKSGFENILLEIRHVRHHVERLEAESLKRE